MEWYSECRMPPLTSGELVIYGPLGIFLDGYDATHAHNKDMVRVSSIIFMDIPKQIGERARVYTAIYK